MSNKPKVLVYGGINIDLVTKSQSFPKPGQTIVGDDFMIYPGGKGANQAVAASKMGINVSLVGSVGDDLFASELISSLKCNGVSTVDIAQLANTNSGVAVINIDHTSQNQIIQIHGANTNADEVTVLNALDRYDSIQFIMLQLETSIEISTQLAKKAKHRNVKLMLDPGPTRPIPDELLSICDVITPNETEATFLTGIQVSDEISADLAAQQLLSLGVSMVVVKLGSKGAFLSDGNNKLFVPSIPVNAIDSVAAGDAFNGAFMYGLLNNWKLLDCLQWAVCAGGLATTKIGAQGSMPNLQEVNTIYKKHFKPTENN
jgi:ribokinase